MHNLYCEERKAMPECYPECTHCIIFFLDADSREKLQGATTVIIQRSSTESGFFFFFSFFLSVENFICLLIERLQTGEISGTLTSAVVDAYGK